MFAPVVSTVSAELVYNCAIKARDFLKNHEEDPISYKGEDPVYPKHGMLNPIGSLLARQEDLEIIAWVESLLLRSKKPISILEVGSGPSIDANSRNRGPWLSRALKNIYQDQVLITVSDKDAQLKPEIEDRFGLHTQQEINYFSMPEFLDNGTYDLIFARHQASIKMHLGWDFSLNSEDEFRERITEELSPKLTHQGFAALFFCEKGNVDTTLVTSGTPPIRWEHLNAILMQCRSMLCD